MYKRTVERTSLERYVARLLQQGSTDFLPIGVAMVSAGLSDHLPVCCVCGTPMINVECARDALANSLSCLFSAAQDLSRSQYQALDDRFKHV